MLLLMMGVVVDDDVAVDDSDDDCCNGGCYWPRLMPIVLVVAAIAPSSVKLDSMMGLGQWSNRIGQGWVVSVEGLIVVVEMVVVVVVVVLVVVFEH